MSEFISEDDLKTFEGWLGYQGIDLKTAPPDELAQWRAIFDEISKKPSPKLDFADFCPGFRRRSRRLPLPQ
jgi:hypothetical protein